jgi:5'-nucleotidase (lipoprotein e(P4) family)
LNLSKQPQKCIVFPVISRYDKQLTWNKTSRLRILFAGTFAMNQDSFWNSKLLGVALGTFLLGWLWGQTDSNPTTKPQLPFPMSARLSGNLYMQNAAEYRACCYTIYQLAEKRLAEKLAKLDPQPKNLAIVMDLDETVVDNSAFQTYLYGNHLEYKDELWDIYEEQYHTDVRLIPGAKQFIETAEKAGVTVIYLSNRKEKFIDSTISALKRLGINDQNLRERLFLKPLGETSSNKTARRAKVAEKYDVIMYFGDNLRDFSEDFKYDKIKLTDNSTPAECRTALDYRLEQADKNLAHWGDDWFVLPNSSYGDWDRQLGENPHALLRPTTMPIKK